MQVKKCKGNGFKKLDINMIRYILSYLFMTISIEPSDYSKRETVNCRLMHFGWVKKVQGIFFDAYSVPIDHRDIFGRWGSKISSRIYFLWRTCKIVIHRIIKKDADECQRKASSDCKMIEKLISQTETLFYNVSYELKFKDHESLCLLVLPKFINNCRREKYDLIVFNGVIEPSKKKKKLSIQKKVLKKSI